MKYASILALVASVSFASAAYAATAATTAAAPAAAVAKPVAKNMTTDDLKKMCEFYKDFPARKARCMRNSEGDIGKPITRKQMRLIESVNKGVYAKPRVPKQ
jgi:predicted transglutaminase-like cysteine proteinase